MSNTSTAIVGAAIATSAAVGAGSPLDAIFGDLAFTMMILGAAGGACMFLYRFKSMTYAEGLIATLLGGGIALGFGSMAPDIVQKIFGVGTEALYGASFTIGLVQERVLSFFLGGRDE